MNGVDENVVVIVICFVYGEICKFFCEYEFVFFGKGLSVVVWNLDFVFFVV